MKNLPRTKKTKSGHTLYLHTPATGKPVYVTIPGSERLGLRMLCQAIKRVSS